MYVLYICTVHTYLLTVFGDRACTVKPRHTTFSLIHATTSVGFTILYPVISLIATKTSKLKVAILYPPLIKKNDHKLSPTYIFFVIAIPTVHHLCGYITTFCLTPLIRNSEEIAGSFHGVTNLSIS